MMQLFGQVVLTVLGVLVVVGFIESIWQGHQYQKRQRNAGKQYGRHRR